MSFAVIHSRALNGMQAHPVTVEVHLANGLPSFTLVAPNDKAALCDFVRHGRPMAPTDRSA